MNRLRPRSIEKGLDCVFGTIKTFTIRSLLFIIISSEGYRAETYNLRQEITVMKNVWLLSVTITGFLSKGTRLY